MRVVLTHAGGQSELVSPFIWLLVSQKVILLHQGHNIVVLLYFILT